jgi:hypothetical protein
VKKIISIVLGMLLVFGFAASAFAIHADIPSDTTAAVAGGGTQITLSGEIRTRFDYQHTTFFEETSDKSYWDERVRLGIEAKVTPNTSGFIQLESTNEDTASKSQDWYGWGTTSPSAANDTVTDKTYATGMYTVGNEKRPALSILQAWILHTGSGLLGAPAGIKIGHMPLALGNNLFFDHSKYGDDAVLGFVNPVKELTLAGVAIKFRAGANSTNTSTQDNAYALIAAYNFDKNSSISFDATYVDDQDLVTTLSNAGALGANPYLTLGAPFGPTLGTFTPRTALHFWNFGLRGNTVVSGLSMMLDGEVQTAETEHLSATFAGANELKMTGYAVKAGLGYTLDPVNLSLDFAYGSGDNGTHANKTSFFVTSLGADQHYTYVYEYRTINAAGVQYGGLTNTWYLKLGATTDVVKDVNFLLNLYYLQAVDAISVNSPFLQNNSPFGATNFPQFDTKGNKWYKFGNSYNSKSDGSGNPVAPGTTMWNNSGHDIGVELDGKITWTIDKNLKYWIEGGYLWAGDFWHAVTGPAVGPDDAFSVRQGIQLNF